MLSDEASRLLTSLRAARTLFDRLRGDDPREEILDRLAALGEFRIVPELLPFFAAGDALAEHAARAIASLLAAITPAQLAWIDEQARQHGYGYHLDRWWNLPPDAVPRLARLAAAYPAAVGVLASHRSGFVREAAVRELGTIADGREIPFLALRVNDWVRPVWGAAAQLLARRLVPVNRGAVLVALPFIVRMLGQGRHDHRRFGDAVRAVLLSDGGHDLLAAVNTYDRAVRRFVHDLVGSEADADGRLMRAALADVDPVVRERGARRLLTTTADPDASAQALERLLERDRAPGVRKEALSVLAQRAPDRVRRLLPRVLLDPAARVRELARYFVRELSVPIVARDLYVDGLTRTSPREQATAVAGVGETGISADVDLFVALLDAASPRVRGAALRASARLDVDRAIPMATVALADVSPAVRGVAVQILQQNARRLDFDRIREPLLRLSDRSARQSVLSILRQAPKWDAAVFLLEALADSDPETRVLASRMLDSWVAGFNQSHAQPTREQLGRIGALLEANQAAMSEQSAELLRFSLKAAER